jgi:hypothetical protein
MKKGKRFTFHESEKGYIKAHYLPNRVLYVDELIVYKQFRGLGYGKYLCSLLPIGCKLLASSIPDDDGTIYVIDLVKFYESCGFILKPDKFNNSYMEKSNEQIVS